ncbi:hypothetical protein Glove_166g168 [Diversispora epigaea]|uniref:Uncharacterized protein n=1 Tax=Diversispora epigaea TaxID=1348612 RepID=A0A397IQI0_9GLOM|nr:hypothetical protein Glove_166g168 [Diversispora epigaea]
MGKILKTAEEFFDITGIQINVAKSDLIVIRNRQNAAKEHIIKQGIKFAGTTIKLTKSQDGIRYLGIWVIEDGRKEHQINLIKTKLKTAIKYLLTNLILTDTMCNEINRSVKKIFKQKCGLAATFLDNFIYSQDGYRLFNINDRQLQMQGIEFTQRLNNDNDTSGIKYKRSMAKQPELEYNNYKRIYGRQRKYGIPRHRNFSGETIKLLAEHNYQLKDTIKGNFPIIPKRGTYSIWHMINDGYSNLDLNWFKKHKEHLQHGKTTRIRIQQLQTNLWTSEKIWNPSIISQFKQRHRNFSGETIKLLAEHNYQLKDTIKGNFPIIPKRGTYSIWHMINDGYSNLDLNWFKKHKEHLQQYKIMYTNQLLNANYEHVLHWTQISHDIIPRKPRNWWNELIEAIEFNTEIPRPQEEFNMANNITNLKSSKIIIKHLINEVIDEEPTSILQPCQSSDLRALLITEVCYSKRRNVEKKRRARSKNFPNSLQICARDAYKFNRHTSKKNQINTRENEEEDSLNNNIILAPITTIRQIEQIGKDIEEFKTFQIYTDGSLTSKTEKKKKRKEIKKTIKLLPASANAQLFTDSQASIDAIKTFANPNEKRKVRRYKNLIILKVIRDLTLQKQITIEYIKVKAHKGNKGNNERKTDWKISFQLIHETNITNPVTSNIDHRNRKFSIKLLNDELPTKSLLHERRPDLYTDDTYFLQQSQREQLTCLRLQGFYKYSTKKLFTQHSISNKKWLKQCEEFLEWEKEQTNIMKEAKLQRKKNLRIITDEYKYLKQNLRETADTLTHHILNKIYLQGHNIHDLFYSIDECGVLTSSE